MELQGMQLQKLVLPPPQTLAGAKGVGLRGCSLLKDLWVLRSAAHRGHVDLVRGALTLQAAPDPFPASCPPRP